MNKTVKTIAWICLVLGILGTVLDAGAFMFARRAFISRQANFEEMQEKLDAVELPRLKSRRDADSDGKDDADLERNPKDRLDNNPGGFFPRRNFSGGMISGVQRNTGRGSRPMSCGLLIALPFLMMSSGPVLLVVGAVILIVNREPVKEEKKEKSKKSK